MIAEKAFVTFDTKRQNKGRKNGTGKRKKCTATQTLMTIPNQTFSLTGTTNIEETIQNFEIKSQLITRSRFAELKRYAIEAARTKKIFRMIGHCSVVYEALKRRDWVLLLERHNQAEHLITWNLTYEKALLSAPEIRYGEPFEKYCRRCEDTITSLIIDRCPASFVWSKRRWDEVPLQAELENPRIMLSKIGDLCFSPKYGLSDCLRTQYWSCDGDITKVNYPRSYLIYEEDEMKEFIVDYRNTACISFLKFVVEKTICKQSLILFNSKTWKIPFSALEFALKHCSNMLMSFSGTEFDVRKSVLKNEVFWGTFDIYHHMLTSEGCQIEMLEETLVLKFMKCAERLLVGIREFWPQYEIDGFRNLWVMKPKNELCGVGIRLLNKLDDVKGFAELEYIAQKYIERPLPIYNAKCDIRQYFLITNVLPLCIWMYTENYIRVSSQVFNLNNLHSSVHLTNIWIQHCYTIDPNRDSRLPKCNMWDTSTFRKYLAEIGRPEAWEKIIFPGMKKAIIGAILSSQERLVPHPNNFELFGADFIIDENCNPWLLEINQNPDMSSTTAVTDRLIPALADDMLKVVLDLKENAKASTGNFQLVYEQACVKPAANTGSKLSIQAEHFTRDCLRRQLYNHMASLVTSECETKKNRWPVNDLLKVLRGEA